MAASNLQQLGLGRYDTVPDNPSTGFELFETVFTGMVLREFEESRVARDLISIKKPIKGAMSAKFRLMGAVGAQHHTPGDNILADGTYLQEAAQAALTIACDDLLLSAVLVDNIDELRNEFSSRADLAAEMGRALANRDDQMVLRAVYQASQLAYTEDNATSNDRSRTGGSWSANGRDYIGQPNSGGTHWLDLTGATVSTKAAKIYDMLMKTKTQMNKDGVPKFGRVFVCNEDVHEWLARETDLLNKDWGGNGSLSEGEIGKVAGFQIITTNNWPTYAEWNASYGGDRNSTAAGLAVDTDLIGLAFTPEAAGIVSLMDMATEAEWKAEYQAHLMIAKQACGYGRVRPECAYAFKTYTSTT
jgi:hypothetical protein